MTKYLRELCSLFIILLAQPVIAGYNVNHIDISSNGKFYEVYSLGKDGHNINSFDNIGMKVINYYSIPNDKYCHLNFVSLDPSGEKLVYAEYCKYKNPSAFQGAPEGFYRISLLDKKSKNEIIHFDHAQNFFSFSPSGNAIVYAEENPGEQGTPFPPGYRGGAWLYDFNTKEKKHLKLGVVDINWSAHDGNIYSTNGIDVYRYNVKTGKIEATPYHGILFSPDGKYNIDNYDRFRIFRTSDNQEMIELEKQIKNYQFICWSDNKMNSTIFWNGEGENIVFDLKQSKMIGKFSGEFIGTNTERTKVAVHPLGPDRKPQIDKIEILNLLDLIKK